MAKWWYAVLIILHLCINASYSSSKSNDEEYYQYVTSNQEDLSGENVLLRLQRDVAATAEEIATKPPEEQVPTPFNTEKKSTDNPKKGVDKFPDTKKPITVDTTKPSKLDKHDKLDIIKKKPFGKPGEKPILKPLPVNENSSNIDNSTAVNSDATFYSSTTTVNTGAAAVNSSAAPTELSSAIDDATPTTPTTASSSNAGDALNSSSISWPNNSSSSTTTMMPSVEVTDVTEDSVATEDYGPVNMTGYKNNATEFEHHRYYISFTYSGAEVQENYWVKLDHLPDNVLTESKVLSSAYRQAYTLSLRFAFPFYGHVLRNITIATGGFLYTGDLLHTWLAATQYIAPLMANFDTSASANSKVKYAENETSLTVQWENVKLKEKLDGGSFTFQVTIHNNGDIVFSYKDVPVSVDMIADDQHPVKVGLSDAYIVHKTIFYVRRKTIYEYHKINMKKPEKISNWTAIMFKALPTCVSFTDCYTCTTQKTSFTCRWCEKVGRCSDGMDRHRHEWLLSRCDFFNTEDLEQCTSQPALVKLVEADDSPPNTQAITADGKTSDDGGGGGGVGAGVTVGILTCLLLAVVGWVAYAYFFPHTTSGQMLIKYRPSTWSFKRGGARYTAAAMHSIHM